MDTNKTEINRTAVENHANGLDELDGLEINDLEISEFLDQALAQEGESISKVMAASCTTCECCCSCVLLEQEELPLEKEFTAAQLASIRSRDPSAHAGIARRAEAEWPQLVKDVAEEMAKGTEASHPRVKSLAKRWSSLVHSFTGGDKEILDVLNGIYREKPHLAMQHGHVPNHAMIEFISKALQQ